jgi:uncharacterized protein YbjT (DUF2867 family)
MGKTALVLGATGLVGSQILELLLAEQSYERVAVAARRSTGMSHPRLVERVVSFDELAAARELFAVDHIYCALGTTIRKAGSRERFRQVDLEYPLEAARLGRSAGASHFLLVSALGADARSRFFYNRVKGELEQKLRALDYPSLTIARPSLLLGDRAEYRRGEEIARRFAWLTPARYKPVEGRTVARAMIAAAAEGRRGVRIIESAEMRRNFPG